MFGLSDRPILNALSQKIEQKVPTTIYYDPSGSPRLSPALKGGDVHPLKNSGLMHQKIVVLDDELVFIGSANMTSASLKMHDNLVVGFKHRKIASFLKEHKPFTPGYLKTLVGGQEMEIWLLPDARGHAISELRKKIRTAAHSIRIALFTFTHQGLVDEVIAAHRRGVDTSIVVDLHSSLGASAKALTQLREAGVKVLVSQGVQLLHHKFVYIDGQSLLTGSANWTKSAFYKNSDCILALHTLTQEQRKFMNHLWKKIETTAAAQKPIP
jgi:cardiolipin synthase A/B